MHTAGGSVMEAGRREGRSRGVHCSSSVILHVSIVGVQRDDGGGVLHSSGAVLPLVVDGLHLIVALHLVVAGHRLKV